MSQPFGVVPRYSLGYSQISYASITIAQDMNNIHSLKVARASVEEHEHIDYKLEHIMSHAREQMG